MREALLNKAAIKKNIYNQTIFEEFANSISHGLGLILSIIGFVFLIKTNNYSDPWRVVSYIIYGSSLIILYSLSTIYHSLTNSRLKAVFRRLDHSAIYILIAGTYTPIILIALRSTWVIFLLPIVWAMAIIGVYMKLKYIHRFEKLSIWFYIFMGWMSLVTLKPLIITLPTVSLLWIIIGGVSYTSGILFFIWSRLPYQHAIWHIFVLFGSIAHYVGILYI